MCRVLNMSGFWKFQDSKYARFFHVEALHRVLKLCEYGWIMSEQTVLAMARFWICLVKVSQSFEYASRSKYARAQNMPRSWMCEGNTKFGRCMNKHKYVLIMSQYAWICIINKAEYAWIYLNTRINRVLNMPQFWIWLIKYIA